MNTKQIIQRLWHEPPVFFTVLGLFHIFLLVRAIADFWGGLANDAIALTLLIYALGAGLAVGVWLLRRWAAIGYMALASAGLTMNFTMPPGSFWHSVGITLYPVDALMLLLIFFFYKRFQ